MMENMRIARVFPRRTTATPDDTLAFVNCPPPADLPDIDEVHVSVAFTYDIPRALTLAEEWMHTSVTVRVGGPAFNMPGDEFVPGMYMKHGYVITSRGCPNRCWFCSVPRREGSLRELPVRDGWIVQDDNLLACSDEHIRKVFRMLEKQPHAPILSGGLEAARLKPWHAELMREARVSRMYFAYDTPDDLEPLIHAGRILHDNGISANSHKAGCYVLIGYPSDSMEAAERRLLQTIHAGFMPYAMLYRDKDGQTNAEWRKFQREWVRPQYVGRKMKEVWKEADIDAQRRK